jgi:Flp pilus assembly protein TadD
MSRAAILHLGLARILKSIGWTRGAMSACRDAIAARPGWAEAYLELGEVLADARDWDAAREAFEKATRLQPDNAEARGNLVVALSRLGRTHDAVAALEGLAHHRPHDAEVHLVLGSLYRRLHRHDHAVRAFRRAVQSPAPPRGRRCWLGLNVLGPEAWETVVASCRRATDIPPAAAAEAPAWHSALNHHPARTREFRRRRSAS